MNSGYLLPTISTQKMSLCWTSGDLMLAMCSWQFRAVELDLCIRWLSGLDTGFIPFKTRWGDHNESLNIISTLMRENTCFRALVYPVLSTIIGDNLLPQCVYEKLFSILLIMKDATADQLGRSRQVGRVSALQESKPYAPVCFVPWGVQSGRGVLMNVRAQICFSPDSLQKKRPIAEGVESLRQREPRYGNHLSAGCQILPHYHPDSVSGTRILGGQLGY